MRGELKVDPDSILDTFGRLYNWFAVVDERGLCPEGWHVSTIENWQHLIDDLGGDEAAGSAPRSAGTLEDGDGLWRSPNSGTDAAGFHGVPGGYRTSVLSAYTDLGTRATWWTDHRNAEEGQPGSEFAQSYDLLHGHAPVLESYGMLTRSFSVRCVRDPAG